MNRKAITPDRDISAGSKIKNLGFLDTKKLDSQYLKPKNSSPMIK
jgi:hypothetical protein